MECGGKKLLPPEYSNVGGLIPCPERAQHNHPDIWGVVFALTGCGVGGGGGGYTEYRAAVLGARGCMERRVEVCVAGAWDMGSLGLQQGQQGDGVQLTVSF